MPGDGDDGTNDGSGGITYDLFPHIDWTTNDLWLQYERADGGTLLTIHPAVSDGPSPVFDIFYVTNIVSTNWGYISRTQPGETNLFLPASLNQCYLRVARTNDSDSDGLSDAMERLYYHSDPNTPDGPFIISQPLSQAAFTGDSVNFAVVAQGAEPLRYQWFKGAATLTGETNASLTFANVIGSLAGDYSVRVTSAANLTSVSSTAYLTVYSSGNAEYVRLFGSRQNYTFKSGVTYAIDTPIQLFGSTKIQAGSIIKLDNLAQGSLIVKGTLSCDSKAYNPAILTCFNDDSLGVDVYKYSSDGSPVMGTNGYAYLDLSQAQDAHPNINNLRFAYADKAVTTPSSGSLDIWDCQFFQCKVGVVNTVTNGASVDSLHNVLFAQCGSAIQASGTMMTVAGEHVTADAGVFSDSSYASGQVSVTMALTNSIIIGSVGNVSANANNCLAVNPSGDVFQSVGAGNYYLANQSPYRKAGTAAISLRLAKELSQKTTQPPVSFPAFYELKASLTLGQQAERYTAGAPDYGYYYDALDYTVAYLENTGSITVLPGTAIGFRNEKTIGAWYGFDMREGSSIIAHGMQNKPITFTDVQWVQEQLEQPCYAHFLPDFQGATDAVGPVMDFRFCNFYAAANWYHVWAGECETQDFLASYNSVVNWTLRDCNLFGGKVSLGEPDNGDFYGIPYTTFYGSGAVVWNNNLFENVLINLSPTFAWHDGTVNVNLSFQAHNNLFRNGGMFYLYPVPNLAVNWTFTDNLFDKVEFNQSTALPLDFGYNAYWPLTASELKSSNDKSQLLPTGKSSEILLSRAPAYQPGPFGDYYISYPSALINAGSTNAGAVGLYQYTTRIDQTKDADQSYVNIGKHYIAADTYSGLPKDSDSDGIPDYVEDANGNGQVDANETSPVLPASDGSTMDKYSAIYDDVDLSGSGLVGRVKRQLGITPLDPYNPLKLTQITTGQDVINFWSP